MEAKKQRWHATESGNVADEKGHIIFHINKMYQNTMGGNSMKGSEWIKRDAELAASAPELLEQVSTLTEDNKKLRKALEFVDQKIDEYFDGGTNHGYELRQAQERINKALHSAKPKTDKP